MMAETIRLSRGEAGRDVVRLRASVDVVPQVLGYETQTGALLRIDGHVRGAFDREHRYIVLPALPADAEPGPHAIELEVDLRPPPALGKPPGTGTFFGVPMPAQAPQVHRTLELPPNPHAMKGQDRMPGGHRIELIGHSHLDVAWLWTFRDATRRAVRTLATACRELTLHADFVFAQSQPQLYADVANADPELGAVVTAFAAAGRIDASIAAMWVEPDCNLPSGESLLRQLAYAERYVREQLGAVASVAWLPDTFGFPNTLPMLLRHAGIGFFATTKLNWNDTTTFPYTQFQWQSPDGSRVYAANFAAIEGDLGNLRRNRARERREPLLIGHGDGGGGVTDAELMDAQRLGHWMRVDDWFAEVAARGDALPVFDGELYLENHRGTYTTHRDVKAGNARLEVELAHAESLAAWCIAVRAPASVTKALVTDLQTAWKIVLRDQFHDVLAGTCIGAVYADVRADYERAGKIAARVVASAESVLPRGAFAAQPPAAVAPVEDPDGYVFDNGLVTARVRSDGTVVQLARTGEWSIVTGANVLRAYRDRPKEWNAWNIDANYSERRRRVVPAGSAVVDGALEARFVLGKSGISMAVSLHEGEPFLRVALAIDWRERHTLLRCEHWVALAAEDVRYGTPHGTIARSVRADTPAQRAAFEVPGQRFAAILDPGAVGFALFARDTYGWSARALHKGGIRLGHSLLRGATWPDPQADLGVQQIEYALVPYKGASIGALEKTWLQYIAPPAVPLFGCDADNVVVTAVKPADDGEGVILRVRECDGLARSVQVHCAGRARSAEPVDACERPIPGDVAVDVAEIAFTLEPYALRSFRIRF
jgi:alpha-mannosidase